MAWGGDCVSVLGWVCGLGWYLCECGWMGLWLVLLWVWVGLWLGVVLV